MNNVHIPLNTALRGLFGISSSYPARRRKILVMEMARFEGRASRRFLTAKTMRGVKDPRKVFSLVNSKRNSKGNCPCSNEVCENRQGRGRRPQTPVFTLLGSEAWATAGEGFDEPSGTLMEARH